MSISNVILGISTTANLCLADFFCWLCNYSFEDKSNVKIIGIAFTIGGIVFMAVGYLYAVRAGGW